MDWWPERLQGRVVTNSLSHMTHSSIDRAWIPISGSVLFLSDSNRSAVSLHQLHESLKKFTADDEVI
jgi:hypothetical protein